ncbi:MAG TPA: pyridoxamine 5'-phosphate oxidase family protein [Acidimicrobiales bacterium]
MSTALRSKIKRHPERGSHYTEAVHAVLDAAPMGHVGFVVEGQPFVIPMLYGRIDAAIYLHGSVASRLLRTMAGGVEVCLSATLVDGLVLARSAFHHSMNYRSAVVLGRAVPVDGDEKVAALKAISEHLRPGRWDDVRPPSEVELRQTAVLRLEVEDMSAKARTGGPIDEPEDMELPVWAGVVPCGLTWGTPEPA